MAGNILYRPLTIQDKLQAVRSRIKDAHPGVKIGIYPCDVQDSSAVEQAVKSATNDIGKIDILINNAGLAIGAPSRFWEMPISSAQTMTGTNVTGVMNATHAVLNAGEMWDRKTGTILNVSSTTALEVPPFPGEAVYHANKACLEAFSNALRVETAGSDIRVLVLRPGVVRTHFHLQRVEYDQGSMDEFMQGFEPLVPEDLADCVTFMLSRVGRVSVKALDCIPTAQRALVSFDREWNERNGVKGSDA